MPTANGDEGGASVPLPGKSPPPLLEHTKEAQQVRWRPIHVPVVLFLEAQSGELLRDVLGTMVHVNYSASCVPYTFRSHAAHFAELLSAERRFTAGDGWGTRLKKSRNVPSVHHLLSVSPGVRNVHREAQKNSGKVQKTEDRRQKTPERMMR